MDDLAEFLLARIAEDEETAQDVADADGLQWVAATDVGDEYNFAVVTTAGPSELQRVDGRDLPLVSPSGLQVARCGVEGLDGGELRARHIARHDPARVLAECAAKRAVLAMHGPTLPCPDEAELTYPEAARLCRTCGPGDDWQAAQEPYGELPCPTQRAFAQPYADHPDCRPEWRPAQAISNCSE